MTRARKRKGKTQFTCTSKKMRGRVTFEEIWDRFVDHRWFDDDRTQTIVALQVLAERVPEDVLDSLDVLFFALSTWKNGQACPSSPKSLVYLSPSLETMAQEEANFVVAHEVAHMYLGHDDYMTNDQTIEEQADALVVKWGYTVPERRRSAAATAAA